MNENEKKLVAKAKAAYARKWRAANPEKVRAINERYWLRQAEKIAASAEESSKEAK